MKETLTQVIDIGAEKSMGECRSFKPLLVDKAFFLFALLYLATDPRLCFSARTFLLSASFFHGWKFLILMTIRKVIRANRYARENRYHLPVGLQSIEISALDEQRKERRQFL